MQIIPIPKILIIEDQMIIAADMQLQLIQLGYQVIGVHQSAKTALVNIQKNQPDLIIIDIGLKGNNGGIEVAQYILANIFIPILFLSYGIDHPTFQKMKAIKPYAVIPKPFQKMDLQRGIQKALDRINYEKQLGIITSKNLS